MTAWMRTNVLKREEKGIGPISFPRLLLSGFSAIGIMMGLSRAINFFVACGIAFIVGAAVLSLTHPVGGIPLAQHLLKMIASALIIRSDERVKQGKNKPIYAQVFNISPNDRILSCEEVFMLNENLEEDEVGDLVFFRDITDLEGQGLQMVENPFER